MRKFLVIFGAISLAVVLLIGMLIGVTVYQGRHLDADSKAYVDSAVAAIAGNWSKDQLLVRATPQLRDTITPARLNMVFNTLAPLGPLTHYDGATGQAATLYVAGHEKTVTASYVAKAQFENGSATFHITLQKLSGRWLILKFWVDPVIGANRRSGV